MPWTKEARVSPSLLSPPPPHTCTALKMAMMPVGQKQQMVVNTAMGM